MNSINAAQKAKPAFALSRLVLVATAALALAAVWPGPSALAQDGAAASFEFFVPEEGQDIGGIYWLKSYSAAIKTMDGGDPPYTPEAMAIYQERTARIEASAEIIDEDQARALCTPDGVPRVLQNPYPFEIVQTQGQIHFLYEINKIIRLIRMDEPLPDDDYLEISLGIAATRWGIGKAMRWLSKPAASKITHFSTIWAHRMVTVCASPNTIGRSITAVN